MEPSLTIGLAALAAVAAAVVAALALRVVRDRYRHLLAAIEGTARQVTELRQIVDRVHERVHTTDDRLAGIEPQVVRLARVLEIEQAIDRVRTAELTGRLAPEAARALLRHLADLSEAVAVSRAGD